MKKSKRVTLTVAERIHCLHLATQGPYSSMVQTMPMAGAAGVSVYNTPLQASPSTEDIIARARKYIAFAEEQ